MFIVGGCLIAAEEDNIGIMKAEDDDGSLNTLGGILYPILHTLQAEVWVF